MSIYEKTNVARALLYWAKNNNGNEAYYLEDRMYAVADGDMVIILTADSYDEAIRKAKARQTQGDSISREALKEEITDRLMELKNGWGRKGKIPRQELARADEISKIILAIDAALTVSPKQGEWLAHEDMDEWYECNKCHCGNTYFDKLPNFCPNCGAKMKGGEKNDT